jgi:hypothetical protein
MDHLHERNVAYGGFWPPATLAARTFCHGPGAYAPRAAGGA